MATYRIYKLHFTAPLHIADRQADDSNSLTTVQSDTLYAALTACLAKTGTAIPANGDLGFTLSSLFPYYQRGSDSQPVFFLPMPMQARPPRLPDVAMAKKVKKVQWVDASLYGRVLAGDTIADLLGDESILLQEPYITHTELPADANGSHEFVRTEVSQRVTLQNRTGDDDALPYYVDKVLFRHDAGLYFLAEGDMQLLERALRILAMEGVGTDRNVGLGFFDYAADSITLDLPGDATHQVALSLFIPESREQLQELLDGDDVAYDFTRRGGWITTHPYTTLRKNAIHAFTPGSVFRLPEQQQGMIIGRLFDLRPDVGPMAPGHPVWRSGKAMMLPIK